MESYRSELFLHIPLSSMDNLISKLGEPEVVFSILDSLQMSEEPLPLDSSFDHNSFVSYILYRLWSAHKRFPELTSDIEDFITGSLIFFNFARGTNNPKMINLTQPVGFSVLLHASRGLLENDKAVVDRALKDCWTASQLKEVSIENLEDSQQELFDRLSHAFRTILGTASFRGAITSYFQALQISASDKKIDEIIEACKQAKIHVMKPRGNTASIGGLVTPDGFAIALESLMPELNKDQQLARCLYIMCHEIAHYILRLELISGLKFANNTPSKTYFISGVPYHSNLEGGYLFTMLWFGTYQKRFWKNEATLRKFLDIKNWPTGKSLFTQEELSNLEDEEVVNPYNSGIFSIPGTSRPGLYI